MSENKITPLVLKHAKYYFLDLKNAKTLEDFSLLVQVAFDGLQVADSHPLFEQLEKKGFILNAPQV